MITGIINEGADPSLRYAVSPTGGIVVLEPESAADFGTWTLTRYLSVGGQNVSGVVLVQGVTGVSPTQAFVDIGDGTNAPLNSGNLYVYSFETANGKAVTPALSPACTITVNQDEMGQILYRALQSGINHLSIPAAFQNRPQVMQAMPLAGVGTPALPAITFNDTLLQQGDIPIGQDVDTDATYNFWEVAGLARRHFTIFVMAGNATERDFYRDVVIALFNSALGPILNKIGANATHRFQASSSQLVGRETEPGFYFCEILLEFTGLYSVGISTSYGLIEEISFNISETEEIDIPV